MAYLYEACDQISIVAEKNVTKNIWGWTDRWKDG